MGAAVSVAGGNDALAGGLSAGGAEAVAPVISGWLYGEKDGSKLTAEQKETVVAITGLLGTTVGSATGNTAANAVSGSLNANSAVGNNYGVSVLTKGRRVARVIQKGQGLTPKDALPVAEAGLIVAAACAATGNCDASEVLKDIWTGKFEDDYMSSENAGNTSDKAVNNQTDVSQTSAGSPMPDPDDRDTRNNQDRGRITRSNHAVIRSKDGRSVGTVINDIQKARNADIFIQSDGRYVIRGQGAREHIIETNGEHITTINGRSNAAHNSIVRNGGRRLATQVEIDAIKSFVK